MKRNALSTAALLALPCIAILVAGAGFTRWREAQRKAKIAFYSHPFKPVIRIQRGNVAGRARPGVFEVQAHCASHGGSGKSHWLIRGNLLQVHNESSREGHNSRKSLNANAATLIVKRWDSLIPRTASGETRPRNEGTCSWRYVRKQGKANHIKFVIEAVAVPLIKENQLSDDSIGINEATSAQIAKARKLPGAKYFRESIVLNASDDRKYHY
jgi:hypothetical protein